MSEQLPFSELVRAAWSAARTMPAPLRARPARERAALIALQCARRGALPPGGAEREWAWITSHEARRWVAPLSRVRVRA